MQLPFLAYSLVNVLYAPMHENNSPALQLLTNLVLFFDISIDLLQTTDR